MTAEDGYNPEWLELEKALGTRPVLHGSASEIIAQFNALGAMLATQLPPPDATVRTRDEAINEHVRVRIYEPEGGKSLPLGVYMHGGGYICGNLDSEDAVCRALAHHVPCVLVSVEYRLGPEWKLPVMTEDCVGAFDWAWRHASELGANQSQVFVAGGSAGGGLALAVADAVIKSGKRDHIQGVVALTPVAAHPDSVPQAYKHLYNSYAENAAGVPIIDGESMKTFTEAVEAKPDDESTFVTLSGRLAQFPPTYVAVCGKDPLRDDGVVLERMLRDQGVRTRLDMYEGFPHYFWIFPSVKTGQAFMANAIKGVQWVLGQGQ